MVETDKQKTLIEIYDYIEISQLKEIVKLLAIGQREAIYAKYGENLDEYMNLDRNTKYNLNPAINNLKFMVEIFTMPLKETLKLDVEIISKVLENINDEYKKIIEKVNGDNLDILIPLERINFEEKELYLKAYRVLKKEINKYNKKKTEYYIEKSKIDDKQNNEKIKLDEKHNYEKTCKHFKQYPRKVVIKVIKTMHEDIKVALNNFENDLIKEDDSILTFKVFVLIRKQLEQITIDSKSLEFYQNFDEPKETVDEVLAYLKPYEIDLIKKVMSGKKISSHDRISYFSLIKKVKNAIYNKVNEIHETIYMLLNEKDIEKVNKVIKLVSDYDRHILDLRYVKDYENPVRSSEWNDKHSKYFHETLLPKLKKELEYLYKPKPIATVKKSFNFNNISANNLYGIALSSKNVTLIKEAVSTEIKKENKSEINSIKQENNKITKKGKSLKDLYSNMDVEQLKELVQLLPLKKQEALYKKYGENLDDYLVLNDNEKSVIISNLASAKSDLNNIIESFKKPLKEIFESDIETIQQALLLLDEKNRKIIIKATGSNLDKIVQFDTLNYEEKKIYLDAIKNIRSIINSFNKWGKYNRLVVYDIVNENIYMLLNEKNHEKVNKIISMLSDYDRHILDLRYGKEYENPVRSSEWNDEHSKYFHEILLPKLRKEIEYFDKPKPTASLKKTYNFSGQKTNFVSTYQLKKNASIRSKNLYELYPNIENFDLILIVKKMAKDLQKAIYLVHTISLTKSANIKLSETKYKKDYEKALIKLSKISEEYNKSFFDMYNHDKDEVLKKYHCLKPEYKVVIQKIHGKKLEKTLPLFILNNTDKLLYLDAIKFCGKFEIVENVHFSQAKEKKVTESSIKTNKCKTLKEEYPDIDLEQLIQIVSLLSEKQKEVLYAKYGKNLDEYIKWDLKMHNSKGALVRYAQKNLEILLDKFTKLPKDELKENNAIILDVFDVLPDEYQNVMKKKNGEKLDEQHSMSILTLEEKIIYLEALKMLEKSVNKYKNAQFKMEKIKNVNERNKKFKSLKEEYSDIDIEQLKQIVNLLSEKQKEAIFSKYSEDLDKYIKWSVELNNSKRNILLLAKKKIADNIICLTKIPSEILNEDNAIILKVFNYLEEEHKNIMKKLNGENLDEQHVMSILTLEEKTTYLKAWSNLRKNVQKYKNGELEFKMKNAKNVNKNFKTLNDICFDTDIEQLKEIVQLLSKRQKEAIYLKYSENFDEYMSWDKQTTVKYAHYLLIARRNVLENIRKLTKLPKDILKEENNDTILKPFEYLEKEYQNVMKKKNGENLDEEQPMSVLSLEEKRIYLIALKKLEKIVKKYKNDKLTTKYQIKNESLKEKYPDITLEQLKEIVRLLSAKKEEAIYARYGKNLDEYISWDKETTTRYEFNLTVAKRKIAENIEKLTKLPRDILKEENNDIILKSFEYLEKEYQNVVKKKNGENLDEQQQISVLLPEEISIYLEAFKKLEKNIKKYKKGKLKPKRVMEEKADVKFERMDIHSKSQSTKEEKKKLEKSRYILEQEKIKNSKHQLFEIYSNEYNSLLKAEELEKIINMSVNSYNLTQGSTEFAKFNIETEVLKLLAKKYRENLNTKESLNILLFIIEKFGENMRSKYSYLSDEQIKSIVDESLRHFVEDKQFEIILENKLKKTK